MTLRFCYQELPICPFVWTYNGQIFQISKMETSNLEKFNFNEEQKQFLKNYTCDFFEIEQEIPCIDGITPTVANISFHTWLFKKFNPTLEDMTNSKLNTQVLTMIVVNNKESKFDQKGKYGIEINSLGKRRLHIHNNRLSPKYDNAFNLQKDLTEFVTICIHEKSKFCCVTKHRLVYI